MQDQMERANEQFKRIFGTPEKLKAELDEWMEHHPVLTNPDTLEHLGMLEAISDPSA